MPKMICIGASLLQRAETRSSPSRLPADFHCITPQFACIRVDSRLRWFLIIKKLYRLAIVQNIQILFSKQFLTLLFNQTISDANLPTAFLCLLRVTECQSSTGVIMRLFHGLVERFTTFELRRISPPTSFTRPRTNRPCKDEYRVS